MAAMPKSQIIDGLYYYLIKRFKKICEADLCQTRQTTQMG